MICTKKIKVSSISFEIHTITCIASPSSLVFDSFMILNGIINLAKNWPGQAISGEAKHIKRLGRGRHPDAVFRLV